MRTVSKVAGAMQSVLSTEADRLGRACEVIQRERKFSGATLAQTMVFGWLDNPDATVEELAMMAATCGVSVTPQALAQRFTNKCANFFRQLLEVATAQVIASEPVAVELLRRFQGVYVQDGTVISLPQQFEAEYPACGGDPSGRTGAAVKFQTQMNLNTGQLIGPFPEAGRASDQSSAIQNRPLPKRALRLADLGYFRVSKLAELDRDRVYWISRVQPGTALYDAAGERLDLCRWLSRQSDDSVDVDVQLGNVERLPCRLLAQRVPDEVYRKRRKHLEDDARRRGRTASEAHLRLCRWVILVTNVPRELLSVAEALVLVRARWQIELLFKLWKEHGKVDESRSENPDRILTEIYAKMVGVVIQHWLLLVTVWKHSNRSLRKAATLIRKFVYSLVAALRSPSRLASTLAMIESCLSSCGRINPRKTKPNHHQLLENPRLLEFLT